jgi:Na+-driven multidrug efflux pump
VSFVGQNIGAKNFERAKNATWLAAMLNFLYAFFIAAALLLFPEIFIRIFTQNPSVIEIAKGYLSIVPFAYLAYGIYFALLGAFQGAGKTYLAFAANLIYWAFAAIVAYFLAQLMGLSGVWLAMLVATAIELPVVIAIFLSSNWMKQKSNT